MSRRTIMAALLSAAAVSCGDGSAALYEPMELLAPESIEDHLVFVDRGRREARLLDVSRAEPDASPTVVPLPTFATLAEPRKGEASRELLVLCAGKSADAKSDDEPAELVVVGPRGVERSYELSARFNAMIQSEDGELLFLFFDESARASVDSLVFNPNQVQIIALGAAPGADNPALRTLRSFGSLPKSVVFSPPMTIGTETRRLALVLFGASVAVIDLAHDRPEITVPLSAPGSSDLGLTQVLFAEDEPKAYLRGDASNDVYVISFAPRTGDSVNDFVASLNQLAAGIAPSDMSLYREPAASDAELGSARLLVASTGSSEALVVDANSNRVTAVPLERPAKRVLLFEGTKPFDSAREGRALLYNEGTNAVSFVDLRDLEERRTRNVELLTLSQTYSRALRVSEQLLLLIHDTSGLSLLDLESRTVQPIQSVSRFTDAFAAFDRLWLAPKGQARVGFLDLVTFHPSEVRLDADVEELLTVPSSRGRPRIAVTHKATAGRVTLLDALDPAELSKAYAVEGYLFDNVLEAP